jgi:hypothetical protein
MTAEPNQRGTPLMARTLKVLMVDDSRGAARAARGIARRCGHLGGIELIAPDAIQALKKRFKSPVQPDHSSPS